MRYVLKDELKDERTEQPCVVNILIKNKSSNQHEPHTEHQKTTLTIFLIEEIGQYYYTAIRRSI